MPDDRLQRTRPTLPDGYQFPVRTLEYYVAPAAKAWWDKHDAGLAAYQTRMQTGARCICGAMPGGIHAVECAHRQLEPTEDSLWGV